MREFWWFCHLFWLFDMKVYVYLPLFFVGGEVVVSELCSCNDSTVLVKWQRLT